MKHEPLLSSVKPSICLQSSHFTPPSLHSKPYPRARIPKSAHPRKLSPKNPTDSQQDLITAYAKTNTPITPIIGLVGWNCNCLGNYANQIRFVNKIRKRDENIFLLCDTRLSLADETPFRKLWGEIVFFNSHFSNKRGITILIKNYTPLKRFNVKI